MTLQPNNKNKTPLTTFLRAAPAAPPPPPPQSQLTSDPFEPLPSSLAPHARALAAPVPAAAAPAAAAPAARVLAVDIATTELRPIAFRVFTKKHGLTLKSDALALLCRLVGRRCGGGWRESSAGERLLDEVARRWKRSEAAGRILVDGGPALRAVLRSLDAAGGTHGSPLSRSNSRDAVGGAGSADGDIPMAEAAVGADTDADADAETPTGTETPTAPDEADADEHLAVIDAFTQPRIAYNPSRRLFERAAKPLLCAAPAAKTALFRARHSALHARLLRHDSFVAPTYAKPVAGGDSAAGARPAACKVTAVSALLGRAGQSFLLFGMLQHSPAGALALHDPTGTIELDLAVARPLPGAGDSWLCPGMFVLVDGVYEDDGGFTVYTALSPPAERRALSADVFGHVDFLGNGVALDMSTADTPLGRTLRGAEAAHAHVRWVVAGEVALDAPRTLDALRALLERYAPDPPQLLVLAGNFAAAPVVAGDAGAVRTYKAGFDRLAALLEAFPAVCARTTLLLVPGDNDPWAAAFGAGAAPCWPRRGLPDVFVGRVRRAVGRPGRVRCASNPCRLGYFTSEVVVCRDDVLGRILRSAIRLGPPPAAPDAMDVDPPPPVVDADTALARKLVKTLLDQGTLSPFPLAKRPTAWEFAHTLSLYPLPTAVVLVDPAAEPFTVTYEGCHVMNPGRLVAPQRRNVRWIEYSPALRKGLVIDSRF